MNQPNKYARQELSDIIDNSAEIVTIPDTNRSVKIKPIHPYTLERVTRLWTRRDISRPENGEQTTKELLKDPYFNHKLAALFVLNGFFRIKLLHAILWRWYAYIRSYSEYQLSDILVAAKKKIPLLSFYQNIILTLDMRVDWMTMTSKEAAQYQAELISAESTHSSRSTHNTDIQDTSSLD